MVLLSRFSSWGARAGEESVARADLLISIMSMFDRALG